MENRPSRSEVSSPTVPLRWAMRPLASALGEKASCSAACTTRTRVASPTSLRPFSALEAVDTDTPASRATSLRVALRDAVADHSRCHPQPTVADLVCEPL